MLSGTDYTTSDTERRVNMSATPYYVQTIKDWSQHELGKRKRMMEENGFVMVAEGKELVEYAGKVRYYFVMRKVV